MKKKNLKLQVSIDSISFEDSFRIQKKIPDRTSPGSLRGRQVGKTKKRIESLFNLKKKVD